MFKNLFLTAVAFFVFAAVAFPNAIITPIKHVTVYPDQAQITRVANINFPAGEHKLIIDNLPVGIINESIRASVSDFRGLTLLAMNHREIQHLDAPQDTLAALEKLIIELENSQRQELNDRLEAFTEQKNILKNISKSAAGWTAGDSGSVNLDVSSWQQAYAFIGGSLKNINDSIRITSNAIIELDKRINKYKTDLRNLGSRKTHASKTIEIDVLLDRPLAFDLMIKYNIRGASWKPLYDARLENDSSVQMICYADITQTTGENWDDVSLTISTATPSKGTSPGELIDWYVSVFMPREKKQAAYDLGKVIKVTADGEPAAREEVMIRGGRAGEIAYMVDELSPGQAAAYFSNNYSYTFDCPHKKSIPSSKESEKTFVASWNLNTEMNYLCRPKNSQEVYRLAKIVNGENSPLMAGTVSIFSEGDFIGKAHINNFIAPGEEFEIGFGVDNSFNVERKIIAEKRSQESNLFGSEKIRNKKTIRVTLKNNGTDTKVVRLEEALPVSRDSRVKIKFGDIAPEYLSLDEQGHAEWKIELKTGEERIVSIPISIEHEPGITISGL